jgi:Protein of unknown function with PCYCGC motif
MKNHLLILTLFIGTEVSSAILAGGSPQDADSIPAYHHSPPSGPLRETLDPALFADDHGAYVAYFLANKIREVLYQEPCYCYCNKDRGHQSLLDCFTNRHGRFCNVCRMEVIYAYFKTREGKTPSEIREGMSRSEAWKIDLERVTEDFSPLTDEKGKVRHP